MRWIFLSPHLDDVVLSCGGMIAELGNSRQAVEVWTICAGDPPPGPLSPLAQVLHSRWNLEVNPVAVRREEDRRSCAHLGATPRHFDIPDCIYRRDPFSGEPLIQKNEDLFQPLPAVEQPLVEEVRQLLVHHLPPRARLVVPLTMGGHIDHHLVRQAAETLNRPLWFYADFPYVVQSQNDKEEWIDTEWEALEQTISDKSLDRWQKAVAEHESQISTFWGTLAEMRKSIGDYRDSGGGRTLWKRNLPLIHNKYAN